MVFQAYTLSLYLYLYLYAVHHPPSLPASQASIAFFRALPHR
jgi:hypothetical protein